MQYCSLTGVVCPPPELWQLFMLVFIGWAALMSVTGFAIETYRENIHAMPRWLTVLSALALLSCHPVGLTIQFYAYTQFYVYAPLGASLLVTAFGLYGIGAFAYFLVGPNNWPCISRR